jgi:hypothetical protein
MKRTITVLDGDTLKNKETQNETLWLLEHPEALERHIKKICCDIATLMPARPTKEAQKLISRAEWLSDILCWADLHLGQQSDDSGERTQEQ